MYNHRRVWQLIGCSEQCNVAHEEQEHPFYCAIASLDFALGCCLAWYGAELFPPPHDQSLSNIADLLYTDVFPYNLDCHCCQMEGSQDQRASLLESIPYKLPDMLGKPVGILL